MEGLFCWCIPVENEEEEKEPFQPAQIYYHEP